ncbi:hypothetical protein ANCDUO_01700 [Ancylostoma duodenale]|uniref:DNA-directed RNA polymerase n=1 Tax=Ancylostoma duodenale TaxID=51022 RepID=A0A0C2DYA1_9BILA|nr:hypothetical protein ANCDUO_01700 [Ancylostoma duodenale]
MRTTDVRKLRSEAWGFSNPVHSHDGAPCGLLNNVTASCSLGPHYSDIRELPAQLADLGMLSHKSVVIAFDEEEYFCT